MVTGELLPEDDQESLARTGRAAKYVLIFLLVLSLVRFVVGIYTGSMALIADALNSISNTLVIVTICVSLHIMKKKPNGRFPYGYYRLEDLVELFMSIMFLISAVLVVVRGIGIVIAGLYPMYNYGIAVALEIVAGGLLLIVGLHQKHVATGTGMGSLVMSAKILQIDAFVAFLVALNIFLSSYYLFPFEGIVVVVIGLLVIIKALRGAKDSLKCLLDIWDKPEIIARIRNIINSHAPLKAGDIRLRRVGPFVFGDIVVYAPEEMRLEDVDDLLSDIEHEIHNDIPEIVDLVINIEPLEETRIICAIPVGKGERCQKIAERFECADRFLILAVDPKNRSAETIGIVRNVFRRRRNPEVKICKELLRYNVDCVIVRDIEETSFELLKAYSVDTYKADTTEIEEILRGFMNRKLKFVERYEHMSSEKTEEKQHLEPEEGIGVQCGSVTDENLYEGYGGRRLANE